MQRGTCSAAGCSGPRRWSTGISQFGDVSSRNRNFRVETRDGACYLLKQGLDAGRRAHGRARGERVSTPGRGRRRDRSVSSRGFCGYDAAARRAGSRARSGCRGPANVSRTHRPFSAGPAAALGRALGTLHRTRGAAAGAGPGVGAVDSVGASARRRVVPRHQRGRPGADPDRAGRRPVLPRRSSDCGGVVDRRPGSWRREVGQLPGHFARRWRRGDTPDRLGGGDRQAIHVGISVRH